MTALQCLQLWDLPNLESLPDCFANLGLLRQLTISNCSKLTCLPTSLDSLESLCIYSCPELGKRCQKETGKDWPKIAHVPNILIQNKTKYSSGQGGGYYSSNEELW
ncbi:putative disease resistance protein RGA4 [Spatholobus suberectus]|nr:putative disease resistance protein RGA4 [Spatholobus suberectus]